MELTLEGKKANNTQTHTMTYKKSINTYKYTNYTHYYRLN